MSEPREFRSLTEALRELKRGSHTIVIDGHTYDLLLGPKRRLDWFMPSPPPPTKEPTDG